MSDAPTLYDHDGETIERVINEECAAAMRSHIDDLESRIREQRALLDECERALRQIAGTDKWRDSEMGYVDLARATLAKLRGETE